MAEKVAELLHCMWMKGGFPKDASITQLSKTERKSSSVTTTDVSLSNRILERYWQNLIESLNMHLVCI